MRKSGRIYPEKRSSSSGAHEVGNYRLHVSIFHGCELCKTSEKWNAAASRDLWDIDTWMDLEKRRCEIQQNGIKTETNFVLNIFGTKFLIGCCGDGLARKNCI